MSTPQTSSKILSIPVPAVLEEFIKERVEEQGFHTVSEYVRSLIRADQERATRQKLESLLLEAVERGDYREATPDFWKRLQDLAENGSSDNGAS